MKSISVARYLALLAVLLLVPPLHAGEAATAPSLARGPRLGPIGEYEDGKAAYKAGDYVRARQIWTPLAMQGNSRAQHSLGQMYERAQGVDRDLEEALRWYRRAAEQGHALSQYRVAVAYAFGLGGVLKDDATAVRWVHRAAENGHRKSQQILARVYETGELGVTRDERKAKYWKEMSERPKNNKK
jgi:TPR repeat protein